MAGRDAGWLVHSDTQAKMTLRRMSRFVDQALHDTDFIWFARGIVAKSGAPPRDSSLVAQAIRNYVARAIRFVSDPAGIENITPPMEHAQRLQSLPPGGYLLGDCDDAATLSAALAGAVGISSTFTIAAFDWGRGPSPYQHVWTTLYPRKGNPVKCDTTRDAQKLPPKIQREFTVRVR